MQFEHNHYFLLFFMWDDTLYNVQHGSQTPVASPYLLYLPHEHHHTVHFSCNYITYIILNTNLLHYVFINYCSGMFLTQFLANKKLMRSFRWPRTERPKHVEAIINKNTVQQIGIKYYLFVLLLQRVRYISCMYNVLIS